MFKNGIVHYRRQIPEHMEKKPMAENELPPQLQDQINRLQQLRSQVQMIVQQRQQIELKLREIDEALEELEKTDEKTPIYKSVGVVLIKTKGKSEIQSELKTDKESLGLRKTTLDKQEGRSREKLNEMQSKVQNALSGSHKSDVSE